MLRTHNGALTIFLFALWDAWDIQRNTHPTYETLWVPQRVESWYVVFQDGLTAALTAWRKHSQEALLAVLQAVTVVEACWRNGSNSFKCFFQYVLLVLCFPPSPWNIKRTYSFHECLFGFIKESRCLCPSLLWSELFLCQWLTVSWGLYRVSQIKWFQWFRWLVFLGGFFLHNNPQINQTVISTTTSRILLLSI